jgi:hypothetical protein
MEQPAPRTLRDMLARVFKGTRFCQRMEIYNPGHGPHNDGSAIDIFLSVGNPDEFDVANNLIALLVAEKHTVKWGAIIYNRQTWDRRGGPIPYEGRKSMPHTDHIHVEWGSKGRMTSNFPGLETQIMAIRDQALGGSSNNDDTDDSTGN